MPWAHGRASVRNRANDHQAMRPAAQPSKARRRTGDVVVIMSDVNPPAITSTTVTASASQNATLSNDRSRISVETSKARRG